MSKTLPAEIIIGIDTHKHIHAAVAITVLGARLDALTIPVGGRGYQALDLWARSLGPVRAFGVEGTGSYGAALSRFLCERGHTVVEVNRPNRQLRHQQGKSDPLDAEAAARAVLSGQAVGIPKSGSGTAEMIRHVKVARDTAVKARTQAMHTLKSLSVTAPRAVSARRGGLFGKMSVGGVLAPPRPPPARFPRAAGRTFRQDELASVHRSAATRPSCLDHGFGQGRPTRSRPTLAGPE